MRSENKGTTVVLSIHGDRIVGSVYFGSNRAWVAQLAESVASGLYSGRNQAIEALVDYDRDRSINDRYSDPVTVH